MTPTHTASDYPVNEVHRKHSPPFFQQMDMLSLSKQPPLETSDEIRSNITGIADRHPKGFPIEQKSKNPSASHILPSELDHYASNNPFLTPHEGKIDTSRGDSSPYLGHRKNYVKPQYVNSKDDVHINLDNRGNKVSKYENDSQPSTIELLPEDSNDEDSSTESIDTNSFSEYIPGFSVDHSSIVPFSECFQQAEENERSNMIPLMKQSSNQFVLAHQESPKKR